MSTNTDHMNVHEYFLIWPTPIPDELRTLFTMLFTNVPEMSKYTCKVLTKIDKISLIIDLNYLGDLLRDLVYQFPQLVRIDVVCDTTNDVRRIQPCFVSGYDKIKLYTLNDLLKQWEESQLDAGIDPSNPTYRNIKNAISSLMEERIAVKKSNPSFARSQIQQQFVLTSVHGFPVENIHQFAPHFACPSCKLVYKEAYELECHHLQCHICTRIRKKCANCDEDIAEERSTSAPNVRMQVQELSAHCVNCDWKEPLKQYETHLKLYHEDLITPFIDSKQVNEMEPLFLDPTVPNPENLNPANINKPVISFNGTCVWEIPNFASIKDAALSGRQTSIYSEPFYLYPNGYRMCLRLFMNGDNKGKGTHMSLFFVIMRGEYDDELQWPFQLKVTFSLLDQTVNDNNLEHFNKSCCSDITQGCFQQPKYNMNLGYGFPKFYELKLFEEKQNRFVQNDRMFIKIYVDLLTEKSISPMVDEKGELSDDREHTVEADEDISAAICGSTGFNDGKRQNEVDISED